MVDYEFSHLVHTLGCMQDLTQNLFPNGFALGWHSQPQAPESLRGRNGSWIGDSERSRSQMSSLKRVQVSALRAIFS